MGNANLLELTEHHLYPRTRRPRRIRQNKVMIPRGVHQAWHVLVRDVVPELALAEIVQHWLPPQEVRIVAFTTREQRGKIQPVGQCYLRCEKKSRAFNLVFPTERPVEVVKLWAWQWVPRDYVYSLTVVIGQDVHHIHPDSPDTDFIAKIRRRQECKLLELQNSQRRLA